MEPLGFASERPGSDDASDRGELLERAVHDLKNPLAVVRSALEWLEVELAGHEEALDAVRDATTATTRLVAIVDDLGTLARLAQAAPGLRAPMDLVAVIGHVTATAATRHGARGVTLVSSAPGALEIMGDAHLLARALEAIVDACVRAAPAGARIEIDVRVLPGEANPGVIEIEVGQHDMPATGPASSAIDQLASGGLGVYLALRIATAHGGSLSVIPTATMPRVVLRLPR